jgi:hypothetical protein
MTIAAQQSGFARAIGVIAIVVAAAVYLYVRERRGRKRRL